VKIQRQAAILNIIGSRRIASQDELRAALAQQGMRVTQATLSRDIRELRLAKVADNGGSFYAQPRQGGVRANLSQLLPALLLKVDGVGPLLVLRTAGGSAGALTAALDQAGWEEIIGTVAGDDTVLVVTRGPRQREAVATRLDELMR
jgi:transcriptional regulator of arginine metabolism